MPEYTEIPTHDKTQTPPFDWRAHLDVHPAAGLFPSLPEAELQELAEDIQKNGLRAPIISWSPGGLESPVLLDGRNRLDALARLGVLYETDDHHLGLRTWTGTKWAKLSGDRIHFQHFHGDDPYALVLSLNVHRRHLTIEQKEEVTAKVIKANPEKSNRRIAAEVKVVSHPTVAKVRKRLEQRGDVETVSTSTDTKGRKQPARKSKSAPDTEVAASAASAKKSVGAVTPRDDALFAFTDRVLDLIRRVGNHKTERFAKVVVKTDDLAKLGKFLTDLAALLKAEGAAP